MQLSGVTWVGPHFVEDQALLPHLPSNLVGLLRQLNGFILHGGALHVRGICHEPTWHSLGSAMFGSSSIHKLFPAVQAADVPFAQDCVADQYILRQSLVFKLYSETGELEPLEIDLKEFFQKAQADPTEFLQAHPLLQYRNEGKDLQPGRVIHVYPPFCTTQASAGVSLRSVPIDQALGYLSALAAGIAGLGDGEQFQLKWEE